MQDKDDINSQLFCNLCNGEIHTLRDNNNGVFSQPYCKRLAVAENLGILAGHAWMPQWLLGAAYAGRG